jgi:hypothetical protein
MDAARAQRRERATGFDGAARRLSQAVVSAA